MKPEWVTDAWNRSRQDNILATNSEFDIYRVPVFYNLGITSTGLNPKIRSDVKAQVEAHGGVYFGGYSSNSINILIAQRDQKESEKLKAAISGKKDCLTPEWIFDSVKKGFALPIMEYKIDLQAKLLASTPDKSSLPNMMNSSDISCISDLHPVNETALSNLSYMSNVNVARCTEIGAKVKPTYKSTLETLNLSEAKKAGPFLDGCNVSVYNSECLVNEISNSTANIFFRFSYAVFRSKKRTKFIKY